MKLVVLLLAGVALLSTQCAAQSQLFPAIPILQPCPTLSENIACPASNEMKFYLYSGSAEENDTMDLSDPEWLNATSIFNMDLPTVILVHGFSRINGIDILRNAYLRRGTHNVIVVDWVAIAQVHCYLQSVSSLKGVAKCTAHMMTYLEAAGVDPENVTCVGHSLGAHICGLVSNYRSEKLQNIVALDPARPLMQFRPPEDRLDSKDAAVVQVLHSSAGYYGMSGMVGTADFCLNNGLQPYCSQSVAMLLCSHLQAICFYAESLDPAKNITGTPCVQACPQINLPIPGNPVKLGIEMEESASGMYCVRATEPPYCNRDPEIKYGDSRCCP